MDLHGTPGMINGGDGRKQGFTGDNWRTTSSAVLFLARMGQSPQWSLRLNQQM